MATLEGTRTIVRERLDLAKAAMALVRDCGIALLLVVLLIWPGAIAGRLESAGFTEGVVGAFTWKSRVKDSSQALQALASENDKLKRQLAENDAKLRDLAKTAGGAAQAQISDLVAKNAQVQSASQVAVATARAALADNQAVIAQAAGKAEAAPVWAIVMGGDPTLPAASDEISRAEKAGLPNPRIYLRNRSYRTVAIVPPGAETTEVLDQARRRMRPDAYPVRLDGWCPNPITKDGFVICA
jgi:hypothetical protein